MDKNKTEKYKDIFKELARFVFEGDEIEIDQWFGRNKVKSRPSFKRYLKQYIVNESYFFSFRSHSFNREYLNSEKVRRQLSILKHFDLANQLDILSRCVEKDELSPLHFKSLKIRSDKDRELIKNHVAIPILLTKVFNLEEFDKINDIEKVLGFSVLETPCKTAVIEYGEKYSSGTFYLRAEENIFKPFYDILVNFTLEKKQYLQSKGIALPKEEEATEIIEKIIEKIKGNDDLYFRKYDETVMSGFRTYITQALYETLQEKVPQKADIRNKNGRKL